MHRRRADEFVRELTAHRLLINLNYAFLLQLSSKRFVPVISPSTKSIIRFTFLVSGLMFSLYHVGYPRFRTFEDILLLFAVGIGFAAAYKLSGNNLIVAYFVNLPNAFVSYMLKFEQFPKMTISSTIAGVVTLCIIAVVFVVYVRANRRGG